MTWNDLKFCRLVFSTLFFSSTLFAQTGNSILSDNKLKTKLDTAVDYSARIYLQDSNTIGVYYKAKNYTYNYGKSNCKLA